MNREHARKLRQLIERASTVLTDEDALAGPELFPKWNETAEYLIGDRVRYNDILYKCIQAHTAQSNWIPSASPSLWVRIDDPSIEFPEWRQPLGSADAYPFGAKVTYENKHWVSNTENNVWTPGVYGWDEVA